MSTAVWLPIVVSVAALAISFFNLWTTQIRRGHVCMTQPTLVFIGRDGPDRRRKIFLRTLLFSTSVRGNVIESMYLRVYQNPLGEEICHIFDFWAYGEHEKLMVGSGLYVGQAGAAYNHHFVLSRKAEREFCWWNAPCRIEVFARVRGKRSPEMLHVVNLEIEAEHAALLAQLVDTGLFFEWAADSGEYVAHADQRPRPTAPVTAETIPARP